MDQNLLIECMRATKVEEGFTAPSSTALLEAKLGRKSKKAENANPRSVGLATPTGASKPGTDAKLEPESEVTITKLSNSGNGVIEAVEDEIIDDEFVDDYGQSDGDPANDSEELAVIDTDLTSDTEDDVTPEDYVGQYVVVCPICMTPLFSDKPDGEIYCPICDKEVEILEPVGKVEPATDETEVEVSDEVITDDTDGDEVVQDTEDEEIVQEESLTEDISDKKPSQLTDEEWKSGKYYLHPKNEDVPMLWDADYELEGNRLKIMGTAQPNGGPRYELYVPVEDLDKNYNLEDTDMYESATPTGPIKGQSDAKLTPSASKTVNSVPDQKSQKIETKEVNSDEGDSAYKVKYKKGTAKLEDKSYMDLTVADIDADRAGGNPGEILADYKAGKISDKRMKRFLKEEVDVEVAPCGTVNVCVSDAEVENDPCVVTDFDTDSLDAQVTEILPDVIEDEDITYETECVTGDDKNGLVIEGKIKSGPNSMPVKLICTETKSKFNKFKIEGIKGLTGKLMVETKFDPEKGTMKVESLGYKVLTKTESVSKVHVKPTSGRK